MRSATSLPTIDPYRALLFVAIGVYIIIFTDLAFDLHRGMRTHRSDLGQIAQAIWNSSQGRFVEMTDNGFVATRLTDHVEPILALISPILWFWQDVRALLLLQVVVVAIGAWPLYELALRRLDTLLSPREQQQIWQIEPLRQMTRPLALGMAIAYLLTPQLQSALLTEFHAAPLAVPLILWAFWAIDVGRLWQMSAAILLVAAVKEEMALLAAGLALWACWRALLTRWRERHESSPAKRDVVRQPAFSKAMLLNVRSALSLGLMLLTLSWFYIATFVIVPAHATQVYDTEQSVYFERYGALGNSPFDIGKSFVTEPQTVWQIVTEPARLQYLWNLVAPFGLLSLLAPELLLLSLPLLLANLLSAYPAQYYGDFHYSAPLVPYVAVSAIYGLARLWRWSGQRTNRVSASYQHMAAAPTGIMALFSLLTNARTALRPLITMVLLVWLLSWSSIAYLNHGRGPWASRYDPVVETTETYTHQRLLPYFTAQIPNDAPVTATAAVHPHLSLRRYIYQFPLGLPEVGTAGNAEWALLDVTTNTDMAPGDLKNSIERLLAGEWGVVDGADGFLLLRRGASSKMIPDAFYDFARSINLADNQPSVQPAESTQLVQPTANQWLRWRETKVSVEWQVGTEPTTDFVPRMDLVAPNGDLLYNLTMAAPPALVWYPPTRWQPGERIRATTLPLWLPRFWGIVTDRSAANDALVVAHSDDGRLALVNLFRQSEQGVVEIPLPAGTPPFGTAQQQNSLTAFFQEEQGTTALSLRGWSGALTVTPGKPFLVWLRWRGVAWPEQKTVFVHLRVNGNTVTQQDGMPRFFLFPDANHLLASDGVLEDVRELTIPEEVPLGAKASVVVGLYDEESGVRLPIIDHNGMPMGEEWVVGDYPIVPSATPDQACAMIPASCATQYTIN